MTTPVGAAAEWRRFWFLPLIAGLGYATSVLHVYGFTSFIVPISQAFDWSRAQVSSGVTVAALLSGTCSIPVGILVDKFGPRRVGLVGILLMTGSIALLSTASGEKANWIMLWVIVAIGTLCVQATVWTSAVASRFVASRGLAFAITLTGASVAQMIYPVLGAWLIGAYGWRTGIAGMAGIWAAMVFPLVWFLFRGAREDKQPADAPSSTVAIVLTGMTLAEGLRSPSLYKLLAAAGFFSFAIIGTVLHFAPMLTDSGADPIRAGSIAAMIGMFSLIGRLGTGVLLDRFPGHIVGACAFLIPMLACGLLLVDGADSVNQMIAAASLGLTLGAEVDVIAFLAAKHFGLKNFGALYGTMQMALALGTAFGPLAAGAVFDRNGSYEPFLMLTIGMLAASAIALFSMSSPPSEPAKEARVAGAA